jgi:hypothetical protein
LAAEEVAGRPTGAADLHRIGSEGP